MKKPTFSSGFSFPSPINLNLKISKDSLAAFQSYDTLEEVRNRAGDQNDIIGVSVLSEMI